MRAAHWAGVDAVDALALEALAQAAGLFPADFREVGVAGREVFAGVALRLRVTDEVQARGLTADEQGFAEVGLDGVAGRFGPLWHLAAMIHSRTVWAGGFETRPYEFRMQTGVSYFSSRTLRHVRADLQDMIEHGCTYVVHCFTETDLAYNRETMREVAQATREAGLEVWFDPWGLCGIFSGETFTRFPLDQPETWQVLSDGRRVGAACPNHPETRKFLRGWIDACAAAGGEVAVLGRTALLRRTVARRLLRRLGLPLRTCA